MEERDLLRLRVAAAWTRQVTRFAWTIENRRGSSARPASVSEELASSSCAADMVEFCTSEGTKMALLPERITIHREFRLRSRTALHLIKEWAGTHRGELDANWQRGRAGEPFERIAPLD